MTTLRQKLTRSLLLAIGLMVSGVGVTVYLFARSSVLAQFDDALLARVQAVAALAEWGGRGLELEDSNESLQSFHQGAGSYFELRSPDGGTVGRSASLGDSHLPSRHGTANSPEFWNLVLPNGDKGRAAGIAFLPAADDTPDDSTPAEALLVVASSRRDMDRALAALQLVLGGGGILLLASAGLVVPRILRRELAPLKQLADQAAGIDAHSLSNRFPTTSGPGELAPVTSRLNDLLARLEDSFERERRFSSDVAHEFRTPVAELRALAELSIKLPDTRTPDTDHEVMAIALHLESVLVRLLSLARGERGDISAHLEAVPLSPLVEGVRRKFQSKAASKGLEWRLGVAQTSVFHADPALLRSILENLVENAVEYSPDGETIVIKESAINGQPALCILNAVHNLEEQDLPRLFDRFWRKDSSRASTGHTGLGLSLARTFARAMGCELTAGFSSPGRLALILTRATAPVEKTRASA